MDERARAILDEARETLARTAHVKVERRDHGGEYWRRPEPAPEPEPRPRQPTVAEIEMLRSHDWTRFVDSRVAAALAEHDEVWREVHGRVIAQERGLWRSEIEKLRTELAELRAASGDRDDKVIDLPALELRGRRA